ncbi:hypothetical protein [Candidatus Sodalis sp. SoCistrobi]|uniref:hypothetical protein n=1 Tax=Candidatus Sodalis sp. SoCistrobi TaxID=1922216 RepID=UPI00352D10A9
MEADAPLYRHSVHGDNPHPGHKCRYQSGVARAEGLLDFSMLTSPHTGRIGDDGRLYLCCENSCAFVVIGTDDDRVVDQIATPSANTRRLTMTPSGKKLFTENEEDASITSVDIAVSPGRVLDPIALPGPIGGIAASPRHPYLVATAADRPAL